MKSFPEAKKSDLTEEQLKTYTGFLVYPDGSKNYLQNGFLTKVNLDHVATTGEISKYIANFYGAIQIGPCEFKIWNGMIHNATRAAGEVDMKKFEETYKTLTNQSLFANGFQPTAEEKQVGNFAIENKLYGNSEYLQWEHDAKNWILRNLNQNKLSTAAVTLINCTGYENYFRRQKVTGSITPPLFLGTVPQRLAFDLSMQYTGFVIFEDGTSTYMKNGNFDVFDCVASGQNTVPNNFFGIIKEATGTHHLVEFGQTVQATVKDLIDMRAQSRYTADFLNSRQAAIATNFYDTVTKHYFTLLNSSKGKTETMPGYATETTVPKAQASPYAANKAAGSSMNYKDVMAEHAAKSWLDIEKRHFEDTKKEFNLTERWVYDKVESSTFFRMSEKERTAFVGFVSFIDGSNVFAKDGLLGSPFPVVDVGNKTCSVLEKCSPDVTKFYGDVLYTGADEDGKVTELKITKFGGIAHDTTKPALILRDNDGLNIEIWVIDGAPIPPPAYAKADWVPAEEIRKWWTTKGTKVNSIAHQLLFTEQYHMHQMERLQSEKSEKDKLKTAKESFRPKVYGKPTPKTETVEDDEDVKDIGEEEDSSAFGPDVKSDRITISKSALSKALARLKEEKLAQKKAKPLAKFKSEGTKALTRVATRKIVKTVKHLLISALVKDTKSAAKRETITEAISGFLETENGKAFLGMFLGAAASQIPSLYPSMNEKYADIISHLAEEFRVESISIVAEGLMDKLEGVVKLIGPAIHDILQKEEEEQKIRVELVDSKEENNSVIELAESDMLVSQQQNNLKAS